MAPKIIAVPDNIEHTPGEAPSSGLLSSKMILLYRLGIILGIISFIIGSAGLLVLLGTLLFPWFLDPLICPSVEHRKLRFSFLISFICVQMKKIDLNGIRIHNLRMFGAGLQARILWSPP